VSTRCARPDVAGDASGNGDRRAIKAVTVADGLGTPPGDETTTAGAETTTLTKCRRCTAVS
jgi:hypothetical protein